MLAWPCSLMGDGYQDAGWAVDSWTATVVSQASGDTIDILIDIAARGRGTRIYRIGYSWTAYVKS
jgi:hypothetical protein